MQHVSRMASCQSWCSQAPVTLPVRSATPVRRQQLQAQQGGVRTLASDSPNHMVSSSGPLTEMKFAWHSLAIALASSVLPQPARNSHMLSSAALCEDVDVVCSG